MKGSEARIVPPPGKDRPTSDEVEPASAVRANLGHTLWRNEAYSGNPIESNTSCCVCSTQSSEALRPGPLRKAARGPPEARRVGARPTALGFAAGRPHGRLGDPPAGRSPPAARLPLCIGGVPQECLPYEAPHGSAAVPSVEPSENLVMSQFQGMSGIPRMFGVEESEGHRSEICLVVPCWHGLKIWAHLGAASTRDHKIDSIA